ncbi:hypothetical protein DES53_103219 [Roseimicrobium gellanilyticum]|uniref:Uncharacterized protein n=1 Tax=Roseimicrobium gellanilyticum TaxID=748857 RepID=A0A366HPC8_9BACT|nr:hypothetical protein [Roseimicrobium gellanilyticum]RBP45221.1 hypothetical protein DES53_103219 [Roseimicrobium gellanilyticum]
MKRKLKYALLAGALLLLVVIAMWPYIHYKLIAMRLASAINENKGGLAHASTVDLAIGPYDPPRTVLDVLWEFATSEGKLPNERTVASSVLLLMASNQWSLQTGSTYSGDDWEKAFQDLLQRHSASEANSSPAARELLTELKKMKEKDGEAKGDNP